MSGLPAGTQTQPIDSITPFLNGKWWIKARVTDKSDIRTWNKPNSTGKLFSFTLVDQSASIRATVFQEGVDLFFSMLSVGSVYYFSGGQIKNANRKFSNVNNDYELSFDKSSQVIPARADAESMSIPIQRYNFVPIKILQQREEKSLIDVLAVVLQVGDVSNIIQKSTGTTLVKRSLKIADNTSAIEFTLWGDQAKNWNMPAGTVLAICNCRIGSFDGVTLGSTQQTRFDINPNIPDTQKLSQWYVATGGTDVGSLSNQGLRGAGGGEAENFKGRKFFDDIQREGLGRDEKPDTIDVRCTPVYLKTDNLWYDACKTCNKKVTPEANGQMKCAKCDRVVEAQPRYLVSIQASDNVTQTWLTLFNEAGIQFFGMDAAALKQQMAADPNFITNLAQIILHQPVLMRIRVKEERNGTDADERTRCTVVKITPIFPNVNEEFSHLMTCIAAY